MVIRCVVLGLSIVLAADAAHAEEITVHANVAMHKRASTASPALLSIEAGEAADVIGERDGWIKVRIRGLTGWIPQDSTIEVLPEEPPPAVAVADEEPQEAEEPQVDEPVEVEAAAETEAERTVDIHVAAGLTLINQGFRTVGGTMVTDNYNIGVTAATLSLSGGYMHRLRDDIVIGSDLAYAYQKALPGIRHTDPETGDAITTAFAVHDIRLAVVGAYDLQRASGLMLLARAGVRYHLFQITDVQDPTANPSRIPSEIQISPTLGLGVAMPRVTSKLGLRFVVDTFLAGTKIKQTPGQEDGVDATTRGMTLQSAITYRWKPGLDVRFTHDFSIAAVDFGAPDPTSARMHSGTSVARFDVVHTLTVGIAKGF